MCKQRIPGTVQDTDGKNDFFASFRTMIRITDGLSLGQICAVTGLEPFIIQNWVKRGFVPRPTATKYGERQFARILLISSLRDGLQIDRIGALMNFINGEVESTEDDIISEDQLYIYFCHAVFACGEYLPDEEAAAGVIERVIADYDPVCPEWKNRLQQALTVMLFAYYSGKLKQKTEIHFEKIKQNKEK